MTHKNQILQIPIMTPRRILRYNRHLYPPFKAQTTRDLKTRSMENLRMISTIA